MSLYARVLLVSAAATKEYDFSYRLARALRQQGHAAALFNAPKQGGELFAARVRGFAPTVVLWDERVGEPDEGCREVLSALACVCLQVRYPEVVADAGAGAGAGAGEGAQASLEVPEPFDGVLTFGASDDAPRGLFPAVPDAPYFEARRAGDDAPRENVCLLQRRARSASAVERLLAPVREACGAEVGCAVEAGSMTPSGKNPACLYRRMAGCLMMSCPEQPPRWADVACRIAEGNAVIAEKSLVERMAPSPLRDAFIPCGEFVDAAEVRDALVAGADLAAQARAQARVLREMGTLETHIDALLDYSDAAAARADKPCCRQFDDPVTGLLLYGWFGAGNVGDDLLMQSVVARTRRRFGNVQVCVLARWPEAVLRDFGLEALSTASYYSIKLKMEEAQGLVYCGGLVMDSPLAPTAGETEFMLEPSMNPSSQAAIALLSSMYGITPMGLGLGVGPADSPTTQRVIRLFGRSGAYFAARDEHTAQLLLDAGVPDDQVGVAADLILGERDSLLARAGKSRLMREAAAPGGARAMAGGACEAPSGAPVLPEGDYFVVALRESPQLASDFPARVAAAIDEACARTGAAAVFLPFMDADAKLHRDVVARLSPETCAAVFDAKPAEEDVAAVIAGSRGALAMRLHCSILHHVLGKPAVGLDYNDKVRGHYGELGQEALLLPLDAPADAMAAALETALSSAFDDVALAAAVDAQAGRVDVAYEKLFSLMEQARAAQAEDAARRKAAGRSEVYYPQTVSHVRMKLNKAKSELARAKAQREKAEKENARLKRRVAELEQSRSYRVGRALLRPAAALKRALRK